MMATSAFQRELNHMINEEVIVELRNGQRVRGVLKAILPETLSIILGDVSIGSDHYASIVYSGNAISAIYLKKVKVDLDELREMLEKVFPRMVTYRRDQGVIIVMNKIRVTESGVEGERGPVYNRVKKVYDEFMAKKRGV
jgi:small nuclear ribonucleoprotein (snRNP)-like protein